MRPPLTEAVSDRLLVWPKEEFDWIHYKSGIDSPVGIAFRATPLAGPDQPRSCQWFLALPESMHDEQRTFLVRHAAAR